MSYIVAPGKSCDWNVGKLMEALVAPPPLKNSSFFLKQSQTSSAPSDLICYVCYFRTSLDAYDAPDDLLQCVLKFGYPTKFFDKVMDI